MEPENSTNLQSELNSLPATLRATYTEINNEGREKHEQQLKLLREKHAPETFLSLYEIVNSPDKYDEHLRNAAGVQLKSVCYDLAEDMLPERTGDYLGMLYKLAVKNEGMTRLQREYVGTAIEYFLNKDERKLADNAVNVYRDKLLEELRNDLMVVVLPGSMLGLLEIYKAYIDGMVEIDDLESVFLSTFPVLKEIAKRYLTILQAQRENPIIIGNNPELRKQTMYSELMNIFYAMARFFDILEIILERLLDEYEDVPDAINLFRSDIDFRGLVYGYLVYPYDEKNGRSIICSVGLLREPANTVKEFIMNILVIGFEDLPLEILFLCIQTYIIENGQHYNESKPAEEVMMTVMDILEQHLRKPAFYTLFSKVCMEMIIKGMSYLKHTENDQEMLEETPLQYVEIFNDSCLSFDKRFVRTKVCSLLSSIVQQVDGMSNFMISLMKFMVLFAVPTNLPPEVQPLMQTMPQCSESLGKYEIYNEEPYTKIDVGVYLACLMQPFASKNHAQAEIIRRMIRQIIHSGNEELNAQTHIMIKIMHAVGSYRMYNCAQWLVQLMGRSEILKEQGVHAFSRLMSGKIDPVNLTQDFVNCMTQVIGMIEPSSALFETLVLNNYHELLVNCHDLHRKCIEKVVNALQLSLAGAAQKKQDKLAKDIALFNMFEGIIEKETDMMRILELEREFARVSSVPVNSETHSQQILAIMNTFLRRTGKLTEYQRRYVASSFHFSRLISGDLMLYLNRVVCFESNPLNITSVVDLLCPMMERLYENGEQNLISQAAIVLGQSLLRIREVAQSVFLVVNKLVPLVRFKITKFRLVGLLLTTLEANLEHAFHLMSETPGWSNNGSSLYQEAILNCPFTDSCLNSRLPLDRKIYVAGMCRAIECERLKGSDNARILVMNIAHILKSFSDQSKIMLKKKKTSERGRRRERDQYNPRERDQEEQCIDDEVSRELEIQYKTTMDMQIHHLLKFQHPFAEINELELFQRKLEEFKGRFQRTFTPQQVALLGELMSLYQDKKGRTRRIARARR